jgi:hypothetical protein
MNNNIKKLDPNFITGFSDAEGCFRISILKNKKLKIGWGVQGFYSIILHQKDKAILELIQTSLGVGKIYKNRDDCVQFLVSSAKELEVIINHFDKYSLRTYKKNDYLLFKEALEMIKSKEHLTLEGFKKLLTIKVSLNKGLTPELKAAFPDIVEVKRPLVINTGIPDPQWLAGFTSGEGSFYVKIRESKKYQTGYQVLLRFSIGQHIRDQILMGEINKYFFLDFNQRAFAVEGSEEASFGKIYKIGETAVDFQVTKITDIIEKIIPFYDKYPIIGEKAKDFEDFKRVARMIQSGEHLTLNGLEQIRQIKARMNTGRKY